MVLYGNRSVELGRAGARGHLASRGVRAGSQPQPAEEARLNQLQPVGEEGLVVHTRMGYHPTFSIENLSTDTKQLPRDIEPTIYFI